MKLLSVIFIACMAVINAEDFVPRSNREIIKFRSECQNEHNVSEKDIAEMQQYHLPESERLRAFVRCIGTKMSVYSLDKGFITDNMIKQLGHDLRDEKQGEIITHKCMDKFETDGTAEYASNYFDKSFECMLQNVKVFLELRKQQEGNL